MLPRMRTAAQLAAEYKKKDSGTAVTVYFLRQLIRDGKVPFVKAGKKFLINAASRPDREKTRLIIFRTIQTQPTTKKLRPCAPYTVMTATPSIYPVGAHLPEQRSFGRQKPRYNGGNKAERHAGC